MRRMRHDELAEPRHRARNEQAGGCHRHPEVEDRAAQAACQQRGAAGSKEAGEQQRPPPAGEIVQEPRAGELEVARVEPEHRHAQVGWDGASGPGRDPLQPLEQQALSHRQLEREGRLTVDERAMPVTDRAREQPAEGGRIGERRNRGDQERAYDQRVGNNAAGKTADHVVGQNRPHVGIV